MKEGHTDKQPKRDVFLSEVIGQFVARRKELGLTQEEVDGRLGTAERLCSKWECGQRNPTGFNFLCWAQALDAALLLCPGTKNEGKTGKDNVVDLVDIFLQEAYTEKDETGPSSRYLKEYYGGANQMQRAAINEVFVILSGLSYETLLEMEEELTAGNKESEPPFPAP